MLELIRTRARARLWSRPAAFLSTLAMLAIAAAPAPARAARLAGYESHACAVSVGGVLRCWGSNSYGKLGDGSTTSSLTPVTVQGIDRPVISVATGLDHTCAVTDQGKVYCWGLNTLGQLGINGAPNSATPVEVTAVGGPAIDIKAAYYGTCALRADGAVRCWGYADGGRLGLGATTFAFLPATPPGLAAGVTAIAMGQTNLCATLAGGGVRCAGQDDVGQLGNGATTGTQTLVGPVNGLDGTVFTDIVSGMFHACALSEAGAVKCWGSNYDGAIGNNGSPGYVTEPQDVVGLDHGVVQLGSGGNFTCAILDDASLRCWGAGASGELGTGNFLSSRVPLVVPDFPDGVLAAGGGSYSNCAIDSAERVFCWGRNNYGLAGDGTLDRYTTPQAVPGLTGVIDLEIDLYHACAVTGSGGAYCWGRGTQGMIGDGARMQRLLPTSVVAVGTATATAVGGAGFACAINSDGALRCWGSNGNYSLGTGAPGSGNPFPPPADAPTPLTVAGLGSGVTDVALGFMHGCAVHNGAAKCWGDNWNGQLGNGTSGSGSIPYGPVGVSGLTSGIAGVTTGGNFSCALKSDGTASCWGYGNNGELGQGADASSLTPVPVSDLADATQLAAGYFHTCALDSAGAVACWGDNDYGQLGVPKTSLDHSNEPVAIANLPAPAIAISSGWYHTCAVLDDGRAMCWGRNDFGQLGNGGFVDSPTPVAVSGMTDVTAIGLGGSSSCAVQEAQVQCWGSNAWGQTGNDTAGVYASPRRTTGFPVSPQIAGITAPADGYYRAGDVLAFDLVYGTAISHTGAPSLELEIAGQTRSALLVSGNGTAATPLRFEYTVQPGDDDTDIEFAGAAIALNGGTLFMTDIPAAQAGLSFVAPDLSGVQIDTVAPQVASLLRVGANPTVAASVEWQLSFDEPVASLSATHVSLASTGVSAPMLSNITTTGDNRTWTLVANTGTGSGTLGIEVLAGVEDRAGNTLAQTYTSGEDFAIDRSVALTLLTHTPNPSVIGESVAVTWSLSPTVAGIVDGNVRVSDGVDECIAAAATNTCSLTLHTLGTRSLQAQFTSANATYTDANSTAVSHTVIADNAAPTANAATLDGLEDAALSGQLAGNDPDGDALSFAVVLPPSHGHISAFNAATGEFTVTPDPDYFGTDTFTFTVFDGAETSAQATITLQFAAVNDAPTLGALTDRAHIAGDTAAASVPGFAVPQDFGANESTQAVLDYELQIDDPDGVLATIDIDNTGTLAYTPTGASGVASIDVVLIDDGGTANGGIARSTAQSFDIAAAPAADVRVTVDNARSGVLPGEDLRYVLTVENLGPEAITALQVDATLSGTLVDAVWSCISAGAVCRDAQGTGAPSLEIDIGVGETVQIEVLATVDADAGAFVEVSADATIPAGLVTLNPADDSDLDNDPIQPHGIFSDGFE